MNAHFEPATLADSHVRDDSAFEIEPADAPPAAGGTCEMAAAPMERSVYRRGHGADPVATVGALVLGLGTVIAFATMNPRFVMPHKEQPIIVTLQDLPDDPPPPPPETPPPPPDAPPPVARVTAPAPVIALPERPVISAPPVAQPVPSPAPPRPPAPAVAPRAPDNVGDLSARVLFKPPMPLPPRESRLRHEEGAVLLSVLLGLDGLVADISVARSSGYPGLDRTALDWVRGWRWTPFMQNGAPAMVRGAITINFQGGRRGHGGRHGRGGRGRDGGDDDARPDMAGDPA